MSRRSGKAAQARTGARPAPASRPVPPVLTSAAPIPRTHTRAQRRQRRWIIGIGLVVLLGIGGVAIWQIWQARAASTAPAAYHIGGVADCRAQPAFAARMGYSKQAVLSSRERTEQGLVLYEPDAQGQPTKSYQDPSWSTVGFLLPPVIDRDGNVYVAPVPTINVLHNPVDKANMLYRIDSATGKLAPLINLPAAATPSGDNPYGILALTYDCDTHSLYVASVAGSTRTQTVGRIFRIDLASGQVASRLDDIDPFGVVVYNTVHGKRLLFGLARQAEVRSVALDARGNFTADVRAEVSLAGMGVHGDERARRLQVDARGRLIVRSTQFFFNLTAPTDPRQTEFQYQYDSTQDTWRFISARPLS